MIQKIIFTVSIFIALSCNNSTNTNMVTEKENVPTKKDSISGYAPVNGIEMYYEIHGEGKPLVLIHGGGSTIKTSFSNILPFFAKHFKVIAVELQAHGHTKDRDTASSFEQDADDVVSLLSYLKIDSASFLGFSNGGHTALQIAIGHPAIVNKLVIISASYKRDGMISGFSEGMQHASLDNMPGPLKAAYLQIANDSVGLQRMFERDKNRMLNFKDWDDKALASIKAPSLIIAGDKDVVTTEHTIKMAHIIPSAELMILPGVHGAAIGEICVATPGSKMPEMTAAIVEEFLNK